MQHPKFGKTHGKLLVAPFPRIEHHTVSWTIHRFERELFVVDFQLEHVFRVILPMSRCLPELRVVNIWGADCDESVKKGLKERLTFCEPSLVIF